VADTFDPYFEWLGIESRGQPPDHYRLLGLKRFESDPELIGRAADATLAKVRRIRPGPQLTEWSRLLDDLNAAKACLLDPQSRSPYDKSLAGGRSATLGGDLLADLAPVAVQPTLGPLTASAPSWTRSAIIGLLVLASIAIGAFIYTRCQRGAFVGDRSVAPTAGPESVQSPAAPAPQSPRPPEPLKRPESPPSPPPSPKPATPTAIGPPTQPATPQAAPEPTFGDPDPTALPPAEMPKSDRKELPPERPQAMTPQRENLNPRPMDSKPAAEGKTTVAFARAVVGARTALANRDLAAAKRQIEVTAAAAQTPENRDQVDRLETMLDNLTQFWDGIRSSMTKLQTAEEIVLKTTRVVVIQSGRDYLEVKAEGRVHRFKIQTMPASIVMALVEQDFGHDPGSQAIIATFLAVDPNGDRALARQYWQEAASAGIDCQKLLPELDAMPPVGRRQGQTTHEQGGKSE
jgi:hypothetical protein